MRLRCTPPLLLAGLGALLTLAYALAAWLAWPTAGFSEDSWTYYELAQTLGQPDWYRLNTLRSYLPGAFREFSAAFPVGYPAVVWGLHSVVGWQPGAAMLLNVALLPVLVGLLACLAHGLGVRGVWVWLPGLAVVAFAPFTEEALGARTMPLALLLVVVALYGTWWGATAARAWWQRAGAALGVGACLGALLLVRFDALVLVLLVLLWAVVCWPMWRRWGLVALAPLAGLASMWASYSMARFGTWWATDNSWVALSAAPAYVLDYPAATGPTLLEAPMLWVAKLGGNLVAFMLAAGQALLLAPVAGVGLAVVGWGLWRWWRGSWRPNPAQVWVLGLPVMALVALGPQVLTGYVDLRYFTTLLLCTTLAVVVVGQGQARVAWALGLTLVLGVGTSTAYLLRRPYLGQPAVYAERAAHQVSVLAKLAACHTQEPAVRYVFAPGRLGFRHGATTRLPTALLPSNWESLTTAQRLALLAELRPARVWDAPALNTLAATQQCPGL